MSESLSLNIGQHSHVPFDVQLGPFYVFSNRNSLITPPKHTVTHAADLKAIKDNCVSCFSKLWSVAVAAIKETDFQEIHLPEFRWTDKFTVLH